MKPQSILLAIAGILTTATSLDFGDWHPPVSGDVRSPCPALNSLANHGFIPRNGKNLEVRVLVQAMGEALNVSTEVATTVANAGLRTSSDPSSGKFNLDDLSKHGIIEHDGSLSRKDVSVNGDNHSFCPEIFNEFLSHFDDSNAITVPAAAAARWGRITTEKGRDPKFAYSANDRFNSYVESAIYLELFRDPKTQTTSLEFLKIWFEQERLPFNEGWRPINPIGAFSLASDVLLLAMNTPEKADFNSGLEALHGGKLL